MLFTPIKVSLTLFQEKKIWFNYSNIIRYMHSILIPIYIVVICYHLIILVYNKITHLSNLIYFLRITTTIITKPVLNYIILFILLKIKIYNLQIQNKFNHILRGILRDAKKYFSSCLCVFMVPSSILQGNI